MKPTINIVLNKKDPNKDETLPIALRITHCRNSRYITLDYAVTADEWNEETKTIRVGCKRYKNVIRINNKILQDYMEKSDLLEKLIVSGEVGSLSVTELKNRLINKTEDAFFCAYTEKIIKELKLAKKDGNAFVYQQAISFIKKNNQDKDILFERITYSFLKNAEAKFLSLNNSYNGLSFYLRTVRAIYNRAIKDGVAKKEQYPFEHYSIKETKTKKRAIRKPDIKKIKSHKLKKGTPMWHARNYFLFSFYNRGMNFADMAKLKVSDVGKDRITYQRSKTSKEFSIKLTAATRKLLKIYMNGKEPDQYVFPILERTSREDQFKDLYNKRKLLNKYLDRLAKECKIQTKLTSYVARHSWATIAKDLNLPIAVISEGLGHEDIKTTQIYLDSFDKDVVDDANELITG